MHICIYMFFPKQVLMDVIKKKDYCKVGGWRELGCILRLTRKVHFNKSAEQRPAGNEGLDRSREEGPGGSVSTSIGLQRGGCRVGMRTRGGRWWTEGEGERPVRYGQ